jgi:hypothetical protein
MPQNGQRNEEFGVYRSACCGAEIVISEGMAFPGCPNHLHLTTEWKPVNDEIPHASKLFPKKNTKSDSAA